MKTSKSGKASKRRSDPHAFRRQRLARLRAALRGLGCDAALITNPRDIRYLTGFCGDDSYAVVSSRSVVVISDFRFEEDLRVVDGIARVHLRTGDIVEALRTVVGDLKPEALAFQSEHVSVHLRGRLAKAVGARRLKPTVGLLSTLRLIKDESEIRTIRRAVKIQERALLATLETVRPGQSEAAIAATLEHHLKSLGAEGTSFSTIVAARANGSKPHAVPGKAKTAKNQPLLIDWGALVDGYCSDMTRTVCLGRWPKPLEAVYEFVLEAQVEACKAVKPGITAGEVDTVAREIIAGAGFGDRFGHGLGHGIGLDIHEGPRLAKGIDTVLRPGMIVTIEPGVYLPGIGGVRIEDDVLVTAVGAKNLCSLPKSLDWATR
ncbi:MAG: M24 family metallopeptidase [Phycisphaeraceae bacterium]|nr:M24 family metallopeptidase [Phycisphaeraceae bacterium]